MERLAGAAVGEGVVLQVETRLEGDDPGHIRLQGEHLQIEHQLHVVFPAVRDARRRLGHPPLLAARVLRLHQLDAPLQLADVGGVLVQRLTVQRPQLPLQVVQFDQHPVEQTLVVAQPHGAVRRRVAGAEELLEHPPGLADCRQRLGGRRPSQGGRVRTVIVVRAPASPIHLLGGDLERWQGGVLSEALRVHLVQGLAQEDVGLGLQGMRLSEENSGGAVVVAADFRSLIGFGHAHVCVADDGQVLPEPLQRLELALRLQLEVTSGRGRSEQVLRVPPVVAARAPHRFLDADQTRELRLRRVGPRPARRHHRVEEGQGHGRSRTSEKSAPRKVASCDEIHGRASSIE